MPAGDKGTCGMTNQQFVEHMKTEAFAYVVLFAPASFKRLSGNKAFITEVFRSYAWQG